MVALIMNSKKIFITCTAIVLLFVLYISSFYSENIHHYQRHQTTILQCNQQSTNSKLLPNIPTLFNHQSKKIFKNFNKIKSTPNGKRNKEKILVLTPLKDAGRYIDRYFELLDQTTYPNHLISIAFLVSDSSDDTLAQLEKHIVQDKTKWWFQQFESIRIFSKDFNFNLSNEERHKYELQPLRRSIMARSRNWLLSVAMLPDISWVAWIDVDVVEYPRTIFEDLMRADADVVVPNCLLQRDDHAFWAYDKNNWQETDASRKIQENLDQDFVLLEGYYEFPTYRYLMVDMPTEVDKDFKVPLDGVGATFTLVKAHVHREGANFPPYVYQHQVETEGFAKIAKSMGFSVYGLPGYIIYHIQNH